MIYFVQIYLILRNFFSKSFMVCNGSSVDVTLTSHGTRLNRVVVSP
jgi:hypothetical protein